MVYADTMRRTTAPRLYVLASLFVAAAIACGVAATGARATAAGAPATKAVVVRAAAAGPDGTAALDAGFSFNMVGALLRPGRLRAPQPRLTVRVSADGVAWGPWQSLALMPAASRARAAGRAGGTASEPLWIGAARHVQYRLTRAARAATPRAGARLRFVFINTLDGDAAEALPEAAPAATHPVRSVGRSRDRRRIHAARYAAIRCPPPAPRRPCTRRSPPPPPTAAPPS